MARAMIGGSRLLGYEQEICWMAKDSSFFYACEYALDLSILFAQDITFCWDQEFRFSDCMRQN